MQFYLGVNHMNWLAREQFASVPLFASYRSLVKVRKLPRAVGVWSLDSGGFTELSMNGTWTVTPKEYIAETRRYRDEIGGLEWAAAQDWMCEEQILAKTGLTVAEHQRRTIENYLELLSGAPEIDWLPVVQGWTADDYLSHVEQYDRAGIDLSSLPRVGIGSVCRRQSTSMAEGVIADLSEMGIKLHGFGFKTLGLRKCHTNLASADSMAWTIRARFASKYTRKSVCGSEKHKNCANCPIFALEWYYKVLQTLNEPIQQRLNFERVA